MNLTKILKKLVRQLIVVLLIFNGTLVFASDEDPWEGFNRGVFSFNEFVDKYLFKPIAKTYDWLTPKFVDDHISNVFDNLQEVGIFINDTLQGKFGEASSDAGRFLVNSTVGVAGIFDVATPMGLERNEEDFGQTFGKWKVGAGPYIVLPLLGPSTLRDAIGRIPDAYSLPQRYIDHVPTRNSVYGVDLVDTRSDLLSVEEFVQGDKYLFIRDAYLQRRKFLIADGDLEDDFTADDLEDE